MMDERRAKPSHHALADHALMHGNVVETAFAAPKQPQHVVGIPARMPDLPAAEAGQPRKFKRVRVVSVDGGLDCGGEFRRDLLVGVERQHPRPTGERQRIILLRTKAPPFAMFDTSAFLPRDADSVVRAAAIDHDALVAECQTVKARADIRRLVAGDDNGAELRHASASLSLY